MASVAMRTFTGALHLVSMASGLATVTLHHVSMFMYYSKTRHLRSFFWTATFLIPPLLEVLSNSLDFMFILPLPCEVSCIFC